MPENKKEILKEFGLIALAAGLTLATQGTTGTAMLMGAANGFLGRLTSSLVEKIELSKLTKLVRETHPSKLNHDLQKVIAKSTVWTVKNIKLLYEQHLTTTTQKETLANFVKELLNELEAKENLVFRQKDVIYHLLKESHELSPDKKDLSTNVSHFPIIKEDFPFGPFFQKEFEINLQLCFGELLKKDKNRSAYIAYQKTIYEKLDESVSSIIQQNEKIIEKLDALDQSVIKQKNKAWGKYRSRIRKIDRKVLQPDFDNVNTQLLNELYQKTDLIVDLTRQIKDELGEVKSVVVTFEEKLKVNFLSKNKVVIALLFITLLSFIAFLIYRSENAPFQMTLDIVLDPSISLDHEYPALTDNAELVLVLPNERKEYRADLESDIHLVNLPTHLQHKKIKVKLIDSYWATTSDSLEIHKGRQSIFIKPNMSLSLIYGQVLSRDGKSMLEGVKISFGPISTTTNVNGEFSLRIPIEKQKKRYEIRVSKEGYESDILEYNSGSAIPIRLNKE